MNKKILTLILAAMLTLSVTACGGKDNSASAEDNGAQVEETADAEVTEEPTDAEVAEEPEEEVDAFAAALENMQSVTNLDGQMVMEMNMEVTANGQEQAVETVTTMDMTCFNEPRKIKVEMTMDMGEMGSTQQSVYGDVAEDGTAMMYLYDGTSWQSQAVGTADLGQYDAGSSMLSFMDDGSVYTLDGKEGNAYKYTSILSGEDAKQSILSSGALDSFSSLGIDASQIDEMLNDIEDITQYIWIDETTLYPVKYEMDMTDVMDKLMSAVVESMGEQAQGLTMSISKMKMIMTCSNFNNATDFTIPEEALAN